MGSLHLVSPGGFPEIGQVEGQSVPVGKVNDLDLSAQGTIDVVGLVSTHRKKTPPE